MTAELDQVRDDLAFMRTLVQAGDDGQRVFGQAYFAGGVCYVGQILLNGAQALKLLPDTPPVGLAIGVVPSVLFAIAVIPILRGQKKIHLQGMAARAVGAAFGAIGLSNFALIAVISAVAWREHSLMTWLIYPCAVFVLQGTAWLIAFMLRRRLWLGVVSAGWFATAIAMAFAVQTLNLFVVLAGLGLFFFMLVPGAVLMRQPRDA